MPLPAFQEVDCGSLRLGYDVGVDAGREGWVPVAELLRDDAHRGAAREHERGCAMPEGMWRDPSNLPEGMGY